MSPTPPRTAPSPSAPVEGMSGELRELLAAERTPPEPRPGLEARLWARLEGGITATSPSGPGAMAGLIQKPWMLLAGVTAVAGLVIGVYSYSASDNAPSASARPEVEAAVVGPAMEGRENADGTRSSARNDHGNVLAAPGKAPSEVSQAAPLPAEPSGERSVERPAPANHEGTETAAAGDRPEVVLDSRHHEVAVPVREPAGQPAPRSRGAGSGGGPGDPIAERALLAQARASLRDGSPDAAFGALAEHRRIFPRGELAEEREALKIHAFAAAGRVEEGRRARARFVARYPKSIHTPGLKTLEL